MTLKGAEIRCCEFVKKSADTGFSTTIARSMGAPTISLSDGRAHQQQINQPSSPPIIEQPEILKLDDESQPVTLPALSPTPSNGAQVGRRRSEAFSDNPLNLRNLPPLRHTYRMANN